MTRVLCALVLGTLVLAAAPEVFARKVKIVMDDRKPNGKKWDGGLGKMTNPDPYVEVDGHSYRSEWCKDSLTCVITISESGPVSISVYDRDAVNDDPAGSTVCDTGKGCPTGRGAFVYILP